LLIAMKMEIANTPSIPKYSQNDWGIQKGGFSSWTTAHFITGCHSLTSLLQYSGNYSLSFCAPDTELYQVMEYVNGDNYKLSGYLYQSSSEKLNVGQEAYLRLSYYDKDNLLISTSDSESITAEKNANEWRKYSVGAPVPPQTAFIRATLIWKGSA